MKKLSKPEVLSTKNKKTMRNCKAVQRHWEFL